MRYLVKLTPLAPFLFGGDNTFGAIGDKENGSYVMSSRYFPQASAILGMLKKEIMTQDGVLTRKVRGEWVNKNDKARANELVGSEKFDIFKREPQNFGAIKSVSPAFLLKDGKAIIKIVDVKKYAPKILDGNYFLQNYISKCDIFDNYEDENGVNYKSSDIFKEISQTQNAKQESDNSLFKKIAYKLKDGFSFAFYLDCDYELTNSIITLGADKSAFKLEINPSDKNLAFKNDYLTLLSDAYVTVSLKQNCDFAVTNEISYQNLTAIKGVQKCNFTNKNAFVKSSKVYLYKKGSIIIRPSSALLDNLNNKNLQQIGYNIYV